MEEKDEKKEVKPVQENKQDKKGETKVENQKVSNESKSESKKEDTKKVKKDTKNVETKKKSTTVKGENKKTNKATTVAIAIIVIVLVALLAYIILMADSPKKAVEAMFQEAKSTIEDNTIISNMLAEENIGEDVKEAIFGNLSWKIINENQEGDTGTVETEVTNKDFKTIMNNFKETIVKAAFSGESIDEAKTQEYLLKEINNEEVQNVTNTYSIMVKKVDGKWQVSEENDIVDILLPGFNESVESLF